MCMFSRTRMPAHRLVQVLVRPGVGVDVMRSPVQTLIGGCGTPTLASHHSPGPDFGPGLRRSAMRHESRLFAVVASESDRSVGRPQPHPRGNAATRSVEAVTLVPEAVDRLGSAFASVGREADEYPRPEVADAIGPVTVTIDAVEMRATSASR